MAKKKTHGICKLTGRPGFYVDSHIIPLALTRLSSNGEKIVEAQIGTRQRLRFNGWYDNNLVTRAGEDILAKLDSSAVTELRKHQLTWGSFPDGHDFQDLTWHESRPAFRRVSLGSATELRLFFQSLLWRSAASSRPEFSEISLDNSTVSDLRARLLSNNPGNICDYPVQLFQIISKGINHNRSPILERKAIIDESLAKCGEIDYVRFYLLGLIAHVHVAHSQKFPAAYSGTFLGSAPHSIVFAHKFEDSRTNVDIQTLAADQHGPQT